jgi:hypothetical protein
VENRGKRKRPRDEEKTEGRWKTVPSGLGRWKKRLNNAKKNEGRCKDRGKMENQDGRGKIGDGRSHQKKAG